MRVPGPPPSDDKTLGGGWTSSSSDSRKKDKNLWQLVDGACVSLLKVLKVKQRLN